MSQGNSLYSYLKQTKMSFCFYKIGEQQSYLRGWSQWEGGGCGERAWESEYGANTVYIFINGKMRSVETIPGMGERGIKENDGRYKFNYNIFDIL
jgi:hypothetical protein